MKLAEVRAAIEDYLARWKAGEVEQVIEELASEQEEGWADRIMLCSLLTDRFAKEGMLDSGKALVEGLQKRRLSQIRGNG